MLLNVKQATEASGDHRVCIESLQARLWMTTASLVVSTASPPSSPMAWGICVPTACTQHSAQQTTNQECLGNGDGPQSLILQTDRKLQQNFYFRWHLWMEVVKMSLFFPPRYGFSGQIRLLACTGVFELAVARPTLSFFVLCFQHPYRCTRPTLPISSSHGTLLNCNNSAHSTFPGDSVSMPDCCVLLTLIFSVLGPAQCLQKNMLNTCWLDEQMNEWVVKSFQNQVFRSCKQQHYFLFYFST